MSEELNWIKEAKEHFKKNGAKDYSNDKGIADKSKQINDKLQTIFKDELENDNEVELNIQGQNKLTTGIWYRAYYKKFGKNYPVVFGVYIGKNGLNIAIQIYNNILGNLELSAKLGKIIEEVIDKEKFEVKDRDNKDEKYKDFGFFGMDEWDENKFTQVLDTYKKIIYEINEKILSKTIEEFNKFLKEPSDIPHLQFDIKGGFYKNKEAIKNNFENFLKNPTFANLKWWDESINSANMQGNITNLIKKLEGLTLEEVKKLKDDGELEEIKKVFEKIKILIYDENEIKNGLTLEEVEKAIDEIDGMNSTAKELAYYIQMDEDKIPLVNSTAIDTIKNIEKVTKIFDDEQIKTLQNKIDKIKERIEIPENKNIKFKSYYIVDQFFNLLHKIRYDELSKEVINGHKDLYQYAYLFANLLGKADKKGVEKDMFIEILKKSKNIIYYGAPGTGKTYEIKSNIENIVEDIEKQFVMTQFHPSYTYEDFIEGIKPAVIKGSSISLELKDGEFRIFCDKAKLDEDNFLNEKGFYEAIKKYGYFFFVDEINRAELSRVFGELLYSLEYRGKEGKIKTQYASMREEDNQYFYIPKNLFFVGTMNDVDRSIDSFDLALRRRFLWIKKECNYQVIENEFGKDYSKACENLNNYVISIDSLSEKYQIGHAYFLKIEYFIKQKMNQANLNELFEYHIEPLLIEYLRVEYDEIGIKKNIQEARKKFKLESHNDKNS
jgi:5-methylcytosine-specific restriction protein B